MPTIPNPVNVPDAVSGQPVRVNSLPAVGQAAKDSSIPVTFASDQELPPARPVTFSTVFAGALNANWRKVATVTLTTRALRIFPIGAATTFDIEWTVVPAGTTQPTDALAEAVLGGEDFAGGLPLGDVYARSASGQTAIVKLGA